MEELEYLENIMGGYNRYEIIVSGAVQNGMMMRKVVLDSEGHPRPVHKRNHGYWPYQNTTSQIAHSGDYIVESYWDRSIEHDHPKLTIYRVSLPGPSANNFGKQLFQVPAEPQQIIDVIPRLKKNYREIYDFLMLDERFPLDEGKTMQPSILPPFPGWDGINGITEEKQSAFIRNLLAPIPMRELLVYQELAKEPSRQHVDPKMTMPMPTHTDRYCEPPVLAPYEQFSPDLLNEAVVIWYICTNSGEVISHRSVPGQKEIEMPSDAVTAIQLWERPFIKHDGSTYGLLVRIYTR